MYISNAEVNINNDANESNYNESNSNINSPKSNVTNLNRNKNRIDKDIGVNIPKNKVELKEVSEFGDIKIEKYRDALLKIINE